MILLGRYMTALMPSNGLAPTVVHVDVAGSRMRVVVSGPASKTRPSESTNMNGYSGDVSAALVKSLHVFVFGLKIEGRELIEASLNGCGCPVRFDEMLSPENARTFPSGRTVAVGYQRPTDMSGPRK